MLPLVLSSWSASPRGAQSSAPLRALVFRFTPTTRAQIAIWIEAPTVRSSALSSVTQAVSVRGIGNRPAPTQMNSGYHWPYGRREGVLPIWAHRRAAAPGAGQFPRSSFRIGPRGGRRALRRLDAGCVLLSRVRRDSTKADSLDAITCASRFNSDKGRKLPEWQAATRSPPRSAAERHPLAPSSLYPPRRDISPCDGGNALSPCLGGAGAADDSPRRQVRGGGARGDARHRRGHDGDAVLAGAADVLVPDSLAGRRVRRLDGGEHGGGLQRDVQRAHAPDPRRRVGRGRSAPATRIAVSRRWYSRSRSRSGGRHLLDSTYRSDAFRRRAEPDIGKCTRWTVHQRRPAACPGQRGRLPPLL